MLVCNVQSWFAECEDLGLSWTLDLLEMQHVVQRSSLDSPVRSSIFLPLYMQIKQAINIWIGSDMLECIAAKRRGRHQCASPLSVVCGLL